MKPEGRLRKNEIGRWEAVIGEHWVELTSGSVCEVKIGDHWIRTSIESSDGEYYPTTDGIRLYEGMKVRGGL